MATSGAVDKRLHRKNDTRARSAGAPAGDAIHHHERRGHQSDDDCPVRTRATAFQDLQAQRAANCGRPGDREIDRKQSAPHARLTIAPTRTSSSRLKRTACENPRKRPAKNGRKASGAHQRQDRREPASWQAGAERLACRGRQQQEQRRRVTGARVAPARSALRSGRPGREPWRRSAP